MRSLCCYCNVSCKAPTSWDLPTSTEVTPMKKEGKHKHSLTWNLVFLQTAKTDSLPVSSPSPYASPSRLLARTDPTSPTTSATHKNVLFANIFSLLAERGTRGLLESKRCFLTKKPSPSLPRVCQLSPNRSWIERG